MTHGTTRTIRERRTKSFSGARGEKLCASSCCFHTRQQIRAGTNHVDVERNHLLCFLGPTMGNRDRQATIPVSCHRDWKVRNFKKQ